jgi:hypothetical protein
MLRGFESGLHMAHIFLKTFVTIAVLIAICSVIVTIEFLPDRWRDRATRVFMGLVTVAFAVTVIYLFLVGCGEARDLDGRYAQSPLKPWFENLRSKKSRCCSDADGALVKDADWEIRAAKPGDDPEKQHYRVRIEQTWVDVPDDAVVEGENKAGVAMVWGNPVRYYGVPHATSYTINCFLPGTLM